MWWACNDIHARTTTVLGRVVDCVCLCVCVCMCVCVFVQELEDALLLDMNPDPSSLLVQLFVVFLNGIVDRDIT